MAAQQLCSDIDGDLVMRSAVEVAVGLQCVCVMRGALTTALGHGDGSGIGLTTANVPLVP